MRHNMQRGTLTMVIYPRTSSHLDSNHPMEVHQEHILKEDRRPYLLQLARLLRNCKSERWVKMDTASHHHLLHHRHMSWGTIHHHHPGTNRQDINHLVDSSTGCCINRCTKHNCHPWGTLHTTLRERRGNPWKVEAQAPDLIITTWAANTLLRLHLRGTGK